MEMIPFNQLDRTLKENPEFMFQSENWWGEENRDEQLTVPRAMITGINPRWRTS